MADAALLQESLGKIRPHVSSSLKNQSGPAKILVAIEATLKEQGQAATPVSYYAALFSTLQEALKREGDNINLEEGNVVPSTLYLLAFVLPHLPHPVVRANLTQLLAVISPLFPIVKENAPAIKSQLSIFGAVLPALEPAQLTGTLLLRQSFASILQFTIDQRPKVRKKAQELVASVLSSPPPPLANHPYSDQVAEYIVGVLATVANSPGKSELTEVGIWMCAFVNTIAASWPSAHLAGLLESLLALPSLSSPYLTSQSYGLLSTLLQSPSLSIPASPILASLLTSIPTHHSQASPWLDAFENAMVALARTDPEACAKSLERSWDLAWTWISSDDTAARIAAERALCALARYCISDSEIQDAVAYQSNGDASARSSKGKASVKGAPTLTSIIASFDSAIRSVTYAKATTSLLAILTALISRLRYVISPSTTPRVTAAEVLLVDLVQYVGSLRTARGFEYREQADAVLGMAIQVLGPEKLLEILPLNILPDPDRPKDKAHEGRAYLLPLLATHVTNTRLGHFTSTFVPLSEQLFDLKLKAEEAGKANEAKVWEVLTSQVWACFKGYCDLCTDLSEAFTTPFARLVTNLLYTQPTLRTSILQGLRTLLQTNQTLAAQSAPPESLISSFGLSQSEAQANLTFLRSIANNMVSVLFNVFSSCASEERGLVGEVIKAWLAILSAQDVTATFNKVVAMLQDALKKPVGTSAAPGTVPVTHTTLDILLLLIPYLAQASSQQLFELALTKPLMESTDPGVQKRTYRVLSRLVELGLLKGRNTIVDHLVKRLGETTETITQGAQRDRIALLTAIAPALPQNQLHFIPSLLPEAILATKEVSEKARNAAFDLLVAMGKKMGEGGTVQRSLLDGMDTSDGTSGDVNASVEEYITMVAAGLAGSTPHMISATITAISRLLFEFKDILPSTMQSELLATVIVFLKSANREIVKSAIGFVKLAVITLPVTIVQPQLPELVPALLGWSHDHKNHFKIKVQHIFERMGRRFGWSEVMNNVGSENPDGVKVLENVKKRKEKAKKKKAAKKDDEDAESDDGAAAKPTTGDAFQDVLYGSDSEAEDESDEEASANPKPKGKARPIAGRSGPKGKQQNDTRIRTDNDAPMDLLQGGASNTTSAKEHKRRQPGQEASRFKTDESSGRMVIDDEPSADAKAQESEDDLAGQAYREQFTSVDGFTRGPNGQVKFHKNTKKRRAEEAAAEDIEMADGTAPDESKKKKKKETVRLGQEFKAKKAGGDITRPGQQSPYAYLPLSQVGGKKGKKTNYNITGKR